MTHIHKKIRHHLTKHRAHAIIFTSLVSAFIVLSSVFFLTRGSDPSASELAFTERSAVSVGSVIPASCESSPWLVANGDGNYTGCATVTCWDGSVITPAMGQSCPPEPEPVTCTYSYYYTNDVYDTSCSGTTYGYHVYSCTDGTNPEYVVETTPFNYCAAADCSANGPLDWTQSTPGCSAYYSGTISSGSSVTVDNTASGYTGSQTYSCNDGNWGLVSESCTANSCANGTTNPPTCDACPLGTTWNGAWCTVDTCGNGATNPPTCSTCDATSYWDGTVCCPNGYICGAINGSCGGTAYTCQQGDPYDTSSSNGTYTWSCSGVNGGSPASCTLTPRPDLSADEVSIPGTPTTYPSVGLGGGGTGGPYTSANSGSPTTLSANVANGGNLSTGASFYNFMQVATAVNGGGAITGLPAVSMAALAPGSLDTFTSSYTFPSGGAYSMRACADKSSAGNAGTITESNESNNCGPWLTVNVTAADPTITNESVNPNYTITFICNNATSYTATHNETGQIVGQGPTTSGATVTVPITAEGNYTLRCIEGALSAQTVVNFTVPAITFNGISITSSPRTVSTSKNTTLFWSILNPRADTCSLRAEAVCSGGSASCTQAQTAAAVSLNSQLQGTTDANDPYGASRNLQTALNTVAPENNPTGNKALGKKTLLMSYTTDFVLDCGGAIIKKLRVVVSDENEG